MSVQKVGAFFRFAAGLKRYLDQPISPEFSRDQLRNRLQTRTTRFLELVHDCVYANPRSPYLKLLENCGCTYGDMESGVNREGLESWLQRLIKAGVWVSPEEFKGRIPIRRGSFQLTVYPDAFENPGMKAGIGVSTGGTTGRSVKTRFDLDFLDLRTAYDSVMFDMLGLEESPMALWYPGLPASTGISNILRYAKVGRFPEKWFEMAGFPNKGSSSRGMKNRVLTGLIIRLGRFSGRPLPLPESTSLISTDPVCKQVLAWLEDPGNCVFQSYVSQALRLVEDLEEQNGNLNGLWLIVGSEPLTEKKKARMESSGARVYPRYAATELGTIAMGCGNPKAADEMHLMSDLVALVQDVEQEAEGSAPLYLSSLDRVMPRILLNTQLGDTARVFKRECGCAFEQLDFDTHLAKVRSSSRFTAGGMAVPRTLLEEIIDDTLTVRYGGSSLDYQFVELENKRGHTSLQLRVSPRLGLLDEESIVRDLLTELRKKGEGEELMADMWGRANLVSVARINPESTGKGKIVPVLKER